MKTAPIILCLFFAGASAPASPVQQQQVGFWNGPEWESLTVEPSTVLVRFMPELSHAETLTIAGNLPGLVQDSQALRALEFGKTLVLSTNAGTTPEQAQAIARRLSKIDGVRFASPQLIAREDPYFLTDELLVRWSEEVPQTSRAQLRGALVVTDLLHYSHNPGEVLRVPAGQDVLSEAKRLAESGLVEFATPNFLHKRVLLSAGDPLFGQQWHLKNTGQGGAKPGADIDAEGAWNITRGDSSLIVAVVDTGCELGHPDLVPNLVQGIDVLDDDNDPSAEDFWFGIFQEKHSTSVCGVASGKGNNGIGTSGVAQNCKIMPIRFLTEFPFQFPSTQDEADAFNFARSNGAAVINNSWGPAGSAPLPASTRAAIDDCNNNGRGGLGMLVMFAAGNSDSDNSGNGYTSYAGTVSVTASDDSDKRSYYSSYGQSTNFCAPSNGGKNGISTTDRLGSKGYDNSDYTNAFGGTSSACPAAAGVALLVISADPTLQRDEVIQIMSDTAEKIDPAGGNYGANGHSKYYGFGRLNAADAVAAADGSACSESNYCVLSPNSAGPGATISSNGNLSVAGNGFNLICTAAPANQFGLFFYGDAQTSTNLGNGTLCVGGNIFRLPAVQVDALGQALYNVDFTNLSAAGQIVAGSTWNWQFWMRDTPAGGAGYNFSNGLSVTFCP